MTVLRKLSIFLETSDYILNGKYFSMQLSVALITLKLSQVAYLIVSICLSNLSLVSKNSLVSTFKLQILLISEELSITFSYVYLTKFFCSFTATSNSSTFFVFKYICYSKVVSQVFTLWEREPQTLSSLLISSLNLDEILKS